MDSLVMEEDEIIIQERDLIDTPHCIDCGIHTRVIKEYYMLEWDIWNSLIDPVAERYLFDAPVYYYLDVIQWYGMLCIGCVEHRLGRELKTYDFLDCPLNGDPDLERSPRLQARLASV